MEADFKLVLLGDAGVGKTALVMQLTLQKFDFKEKVRYQFLRFPYLLDF